MSTIVLARQVQPESFGPTKVLHVHGYSDESEAVRIAQRVIDAIDASGGFNKIRCLDEEVEVTAKASSHSITVEDVGRLYVPCILPMSEDLGGEWIVEIFRDPKGRIQTELGWFWEGQHVVKLFDVGKEIQDSPCL